MPRLVVPILLRPLRISRASSRRAVIGQHEVRGLADEEPAGELDAALLQALDFLHQRDRVDDDAVGDDAFLPARRMPEGMRCRTNFSLPISTV